MGRKRIEAGRVVPVVDGPMDGSVAFPAREQFTYLNEAGEAYSTPSAGRALYERIDGIWHFAGHNRYLCVGCRALVDGAAGPRCPLCGAVQP